MSRKIKGLEAHIAPRRLAALLLSCAMLPSCGGPPGGPSPPPPPPPPPNAAPVITSIEVSSTRVEVNEAVSVRAVVVDAETPVEALIYEWSADGGTFSGTGSTVTWRPPAGAMTPADFVLRLVVRELYGSGSEHRVTGNSPSIRVHDSPTELRLLSLSFLEKFGDSSISPEACVVDFADSCKGKRAELEDIRYNREYFEIRSYSLEFDRVTIVPGASPPARMVVGCEFRSRIVKCPSNVPTCVVGVTERVRGDCLLTGVYEMQRWWLCDSNFDGERVPALLPFFRGE